MASQHKKTSVQYTLRDVPARVDQALRHIAEETDRSLNEVAKEALTQWVNLPSEDPQDLNSFFGSWIIISVKPENGEQLEKWLDQAVDASSLEDVFTIG
jgi:hypothetical protein